MLPLFRQYSRYVAHFVESSNKGKQKNGKRTQQMDFAQGADTLIMDFSRAYSTSGQPSKGCLK